MNNDSNPVIPKRRGRPPKQHPVELPPEKQLETIMTQIATAIPSPPEQAFVEDAVVPPMIDYTKAGRLAANDIAQVVNPQNVNYGVVFIVGDIKGTKVHGFYLQPGAKKEFITVDMADITNDKGIAIYGEARIKSRQPVSQQWKDEHGQTN